MVLGPLSQRARRRLRPASASVAASAGVGAVAVIVLQNKVIADWFTGRCFMWAISVSVAAYPIGVGLAQLILPPVALVYGWRAAFLSDAVPMARVAGAVPGDLPSFAACRTSAAPVHAAGPARMPAAGDRRADLDRLHRRLFWIHGVRAIDDGVARRRLGADRSRPDHRDLGQRAGDAYWLGPRRPVRGLRRSSCSAHRRWSSAWPVPRCWTTR